MASKNELIEIRMKLLGAREVAEGTSTASKGIEKVGKSTKRTRLETAKAAKANSILTKGYSHLGKAARYGLGFIGIGGIFALQQAVANTEELAKTTTGLNRNLGLSISTGSQWAAVAHARGIATTALNMSFTKMGRAFVEANRKGGTARTALNQLGITQAETTKGAHNFNYALGLVGKKFGEAKAGPERQSAAMSLLGKGYSTVLPLFSQGNEALKEQLHWANEYGVTLSGKTNKGLMEMVEAQRENKVAMLGLQVSLTKALMPAIQAGDEQLQTFIKTLNDPKMSAAEKITAIQKQFEGIETTIVKVITAALPSIAEHAGQLGVQMAGALWEGFRHSDLIGKFVIGAYIFNMFGGAALAKAGAKKVGRSLGTEFGVGIVGGAVGFYLGYELWESLSKRSQAEISLAATNAGIDFANYFIRAFNEANPLGFFGVELEEIEHAHGELTPAEAYGPPPGSGTAPGIGKGLGGGHGRTVAEKRRSYEQLWGAPPPPGPPPWPPPKSSQRNRPVPSNGPSAGASALGGSGALSLPAGASTTHIHLHMDGKEIAKATLKQGQDRAALK